MLTAEPHQPARHEVRVPHLALPGLGAVTEPSSQTALSVRPEGEREGQTGTARVLAVRRTGGPGVSQEVGTAGLTSPVCRADTGPALTSFTPPTGGLAQRTVRLAGWDGTDGSAMVLYGIRELAPAIPRTTPPHRGGPVRSHCPSLGPAPGLKMRRKYLSEVWSGLQSDNQTS